VRSSGVSGPLPEHVHDPTAARIWGITRELATSTLLTLADKGYAGVSGNVITLYKPPSLKTANAPMPGCRARRAC
jgi:hypothetical protein